MTPDELPPAAIRATVSQAVPETGGVVYASTTPRGPGAVDVGGETVPVDRPAILVFHDEMPGANWMHPCSYTLVDASDGTVIARVASDRPPTFGRLTTDWIVVSDPDGLADLISSEEDASGGER
jgi:hypothetical protein